MKALITGAGGFIGSHLAELCVALGYDVRAFVRYNSNNHWGWLESSGAKDDLDVVTGDIRDYDSVHAATQGVDVVFHLAALIGIPYSYVSPKAYIDTNIVGTYNILESCRQREVANVLVTSTSETYGTAQYVPIDEKHPAVGQSPYAATKVAADQLAISYHRSFGLPVKIVRPFNTYGPRQSARAIIPTIITQVLSGVQTMQLGNLHPTRDFTYVKDTAQGFVEIMQADALVGTATNIGMNEEISVGDLIRLLLDLLSADSVQILEDENRIRPQASEVERLRCNNVKLQECTGWSPQYTLREGLAETIAWLRENLMRYKPDVYNV